MDIQTKKKVLQRLKIIEGQVRGLQSLIEQDTYCVDVLRQSAAVKQALSGVEDVILEGHLKTHVVHHIQHGRAKESIKEIMDVYKISKQK
jgi:CsoR family transcriptional regulator, copper-sensing transcriptional repressor